MFTHSLPSNERLFIALNWDNTILLRMSFTILLRAHANLLNPAVDSQCSLCIDEKQIVEASRPLERLYAVVRSSAPF